MENAMDVEYRAYESMGQIRTADGAISTREYVRQVRGMTVDQFERRYGAAGESRESVKADVPADPDDYYRRLIALTVSEDL